MRMMRAALAPALGMLTIWFSNAGAAGPMSIQEAVEQAVANHLSLKTAAARVDAAKASTQALWESYAPQVTLFAGAQRNQVSGTTTTTTPGLFNSTTTVSRSFSESDTEAVAGGNIEEFLFDFGTFAAQRRAADERHGAQRAARETQRLDVSLNVKVAYYNLLRATRFLRYNQDIIDQRRNRRNEIAALAKSDSGRRQDLLQAELDLANGQLTLAKSESELAEADATFSDALGEQTPAPHSLADDVTLKVILLDLQQAVDRALNIRPEVEQAEAVVRAQQAEVDAAWAAYFPRFSTYFNVTSLTPTGASSLHQLTVVGGGLEVRVPMTGLVSTDRLRQAEAALQEAKAREQEVRQAVSLAVNRSYRALREAIERIRIANELAGYGERNWQETRARERKGLGGSAESTKAYSLLYDARVNLIQASYDAKIAEARLERSVGADL